MNVWTERLPDVPITLSMAPTPEVVALLRDGGADAGFVRLPIDRDGLNVIPLYVETTVVVTPKDHAVTAADEVTLADLADDDIFHPLDDALQWTTLPGRPAFTRPPTTAETIPLVASGTGLVLVPPVTGPPVPPQRPHVPAGDGRPAIPDRPDLADGRDDGPDGRLHRHSPRPHGQQLPRPPPAPPPPKKTKKTSTKKTPHPSPQKNRRGRRR
ncbi:LysR substrate-binding domain-containing protein [Nonomuraea salmonea]|uniref:LysR substrate-binding domain-containing protein n=1 Tax=Nonomuraea salmonea TaxID=46181 RepID=UPI002FEC79C5